MTSYRLLYTFILIIGLTILGCSRTKVLTSSQAPAQITVDGSLTDWPRDRIQMNPQGDYDLFFSNDEEFLYVFVGLKNNQLYQSIKRYGLRFYFDSDKDPRRSFGIVYPVGIMDVLSDIPGARKEYLENPGWENQPENRRLIESIEENLPDRVMIIQRTNKRDPLRPVPIGRDALRAQSVELSMDRTSSVMQIEMKIPLRSSRMRQFAIDVQNNKDIHFGFEIVPPTLEEMMGESYRSEQMNPSARDPYGNRVDQAQSYQRLLMQTNNSYVRWNRIRLSK